MLGRGEWIPPSCSLKCIFFIYTTWARIKLINHGSLDSLLWLFVFIFSVDYSLLPVLNSKHLLFFTHIFSSLISNRNNSHKWWDLHLLIWHKLSCFLGIRGHTSLYDTFAKSMGFITLIWCIALCSRIWGLHKLRPLINISYNQK